MTPHERAVKDALRTGDQIRVLFNRLGNRQHPRGRILSAYRQAHRALRSGTLTTPLAIVVLAELRAAIEATARETLGDASLIGSGLAVRNLKAYGLPDTELAYNTLEELNAWLAVFDSQAQAVQGIVASDGDLDLIIGDGSRVGILSPTPVTRSGARWLESAAMAAYAQTLTRGVRQDDAEPDFMRQAIAAIDERTTDCCLRVHGQTIRMNDQFVLRGTPRYADRMSRPGFHDYCRTSVALVKVEDAEDELTQAMTTAARNELRAREETGQRQGIHPADALSGRG